MLTFEEAVEKVRKDYPGNLIRTGCETPDEYRFQVSPGKYYAIDDLAVLTVVVDKKTGKTRSEGMYDLSNRYDDIRDLDRIYKMMRKTRRPVDLTKEQWEEYLLWCGAEDPSMDTSKMSDEEIEAINAARRRSKEMHKKLNSMK